MGDRILCAVPGCRRTMAKAATIFSEHLCARHWVLVPRRMRRVLHRLHRIMRRADSYHHKTRERRVWSRIKRHAIQRAAGI